jgi:hypothetical protein
MKKPPRESWGLKRGGFFALRSWGKAESFHKLTACAGPTRTKMALKANS